MRSKSTLTRKSATRFLIECWLSIYKAFLKLLRWCTRLVTIFEQPKLSTSQMSSQKHAPIRFIDNLTTAEPFYSNYNSHILDRYPLNRLRMKFRVGIIIIRFNCNIFCFFFLSIWVKNGQNAKSNNFSFYILT